MANCALVLLLAWKNQLLQFQELALDQFKWTSWIIYEISVMAEREGFEPPIGLHLCRISSAVHSTTLPPLLKGQVGAGPGGRGVF
jgi:hypothetical protein